MGDIVSRWNMFWSKKRRQKTVKQLLLDAATRIETHGWYTSKVTSHSSSSRLYCAATAITTDKSDKTIEDAALEALKQDLGVKSVKDIFRWNDSQSWAEDVIDRLRKVANEL